MSVAFAYDAAERNSMLIPWNADQIRGWIEDQAQLAAWAASAEVQAMHNELAALYRSQLACLSASDVLSGCEAAGLALQLAA
jgi:hypothetical protein